jgi:hypothetical protein
MIRARRPIRKDMRFVCRLALVAVWAAWPLAAIGSGDEVKLRGSVHAGDRPVAHAAVGRLERLAYDASPPFAFATERYTAGARVRLLDNLSLSAGIVRQASDAPAMRLDSAIDVGLTYALRLQ